MSALEISMLLIMISHWLMVSLFAHWWGGYSYGPRLFTDVLPYCCYFMIPAIRTIQSLKGGMRRVWISFVVLTAIAGIIIHRRGSECEGVRLWNSVPQGIDTAPDRLWDWDDIPFVRACEKAQRK